MQGRASNLANYSVATHNPPYEYHNKKDQGDSKDSGLWLVQNSSK